MLAFYASTAFAQDAPVRMLYGSPITLENAKKAAAAALAVAHKVNGTPSVAIVDIAGDLVYFEKMDGADTGSADNAIDGAPVDLVGRAQPDRVEPGQDVELVEHDAADRVDGLPAG